MRYMYRDMYMYMYMYLTQIYAHNISYSNDGTLLMYLTLFSRRQCYLRGTADVSPQHVHPLLMKCKFSRSKVTFGSCGRVFPVLFSRAAMIHSGAGSEFFNDEPSARVVA